MNVLIDTLVAGFLPALLIGGTMGGVIAYIGLKLYDKERARTPLIITLCGSTRFTREMMREAWRLTKAGNIVIHWNILESEEEFSHGAEKEGAAVKKVIDDLYLHKVAMADEVRVLNVGGYVGESTRNELAHARKLDKEITWLEPDRIPDDLR